MNAEPLIHIGYHKTGSTWLQKKVFRAEGATMHCPLTPREIIDLLVQVNGFEYDVAQVREYIHKRFDEDLNPGAMPVVTAERFSGHIDMGGFDSRPLADRLKETFPDARILIVIREQRSIMLSAYKRYIRHCGTASIREYLGSPNESRARVPVFSLEHFKYHRLIAHYQEIYGNERVLVLPYEQMCQESAAFVRRISDWCGAPPFKDISTGRMNPGLASLLVLLKRRLNLFVGHDAINLAAPPKRARLNSALMEGLRAAQRMLPKPILNLGSARMNQVVEDLARGRFDESNRKTAELIGIDLKAYGYALSG